MVKITYAQLCKSCYQIHRIFKQPTFQPILTPNFFAYKVEEGLQVSLLKVEEK